MTRLTLTRLSNHFNRRYVYYAMFTLFFQQIISLSFTILYIDNYNHLLTDLAFIIHFNRVCHTGSKATNKML